jgi:molybdopterin molybdotransferase
MSEMLSVQAAEALILNLVTPLNPQRDTEIVDLQAATGRILAAPIQSHLDFPHWDNSAMDGYAVRYADLQNCRTDNPVTLEIVEEIPAGYQPRRTVQSGQAARILTGSMMPAGADTVVIQEAVERQDNHITVFSAPEREAFVRHRAAFYQAGMPLLPAGLVLSAAAIAVLAAMQCLNVVVYRRPRVAILSTGDELTTPDQPLEPGKIVDSNQYALAALVAQAGAEPICMGVVPDRPEALKAAIAQATAQADFVISSGGVSVGDYDYVDRILAELGAEIQVRSVAVKPGKPLTVAAFVGTKRQGNADQSPFPVLYFGLPGNPVSALVTYWRFVLPALRKLSGRSDSWQPTFVRGRSLQDLHSDGKRETYLWGKADLVNGVYEFHLAGGSHSSGNLINLANTNSLAIVPAGQTQIASGGSIELMLV